MLDVLSARIHIDVICRNPAAVNGLDAISLALHHADVLLLHKARFFVGRVQGKGQAVLAVDIGFDAHILRVLRHAKPAGRKGGFVVRVYSDIVSHG